MPRPSDEPQRVEDEQTHGAIIAVSLVLLSGLTGHLLMQRLMAVLVAFGLPGPQAAQLVAMLHNGLVISTPSAPEGSASRLLERGVASRRAMYIVAASKRLMAGGSVAAEKRFFKAHLQAEKNRAEAVEAVDREAKRQRQAGTIGRILIGWHATLDDRTTPLCRAAHGRNFYADTPPQIGYPGTQHGGQCRCRGGKPWFGGEMLP